MNSKTRILRTIRGQDVDRVPIYAPAPDVTQSIINPAGVDVSFPVAYLLMDGIPALDEWITQDPNYLEVAKLAEAKCEKVWTYGFPELDRRFLLIPREFIKITKVQKKGASFWIHYCVKTPKGDLEYICEKQKNISTVWDRKFLLKDKKDVEKILSVPWYFQKPDVEDFFKYKNKIEQKGGLMYVFVSTPLVCVSQLFPFEEFLTWCAVEKSTIIRLIETAFERIYQQLEYLLQNGVGPIFHFGGSEQATPPLMSPELYDEFVVKYDKQLFALVHKYNCYVAVHCHGRIAHILDKMINMGADLTDPVEPPPNGDIEISEAKRKTQGKITLVGNIEFEDLEHCSPKEIDEKVRKAIYEGGRKKFILAPSAGPITFVSDRLRENCIQFIESGLKYGQF